MKEELEKRLEEANSAKAKLEASMQEKINDLQSLKSEGEKKHADQMSMNHVN